MRLHAPRTEHTYQRNNECLNAHTTTGRGGFDFGLECCWRDHSHRHTSWLRSLPPSLPLALPLRLCPVEINQARSYLDARALSVFLSYLHWLISLFLPPIYPFFSPAASFATGAIKSGMIGLKDVLLQIDDTPVAAMSLEELNARTVGAEV